MKNSIITLFTVLGFLVLSISGVGAVPQNQSHGSHGAVYIMSNNPSGNQVITYNREADGSLTWAGTIATNGLGLNGLTGSNQGGLVLSSDGKWLIVVNAGSNDVSLFKVSSNGLELADKVASGGVMPVSVTVHKDTIYVLNAGNGETIGNIAGFFISDGKLSPIDGSTRPLSAPATVAEISFNTAGSLLAVTEKSTNTIDVYTVNSDGVAAGPITNQSSGATPFGFVFDSRGQLLVSEAPGSAASSYAVSDSGSLTIISGSVANGQAAACWLVATGNSRFAYTANAHNHTISSYTIGKEGSLTLLQPVAADTGSTDLDMTVSGNNQFLYVYIHGSNSIQGYSIASNGSLQLVTTVTGVPVSADGLTAN